MIKDFKTSSAIKNSIYTYFLTKNERAHKITVVFIFSLMLTIAYLGSHLLSTLYILYGYKDAYILELEILADTSNYYDIKGAVNIVLQNYLSMPVYIHTIVTFFYADIKKGSKEEEIEFAVTTAYVNKLVNGSVITIKTKGLASLPFEDNLAFVCNGMALNNLERPFKYKVFIDASYKIFGFPMRSTIFLDKENVYHPGLNIALQRLYSQAHNTIVSRESLKYSPEERKDRAASKGYSYLTSLSEITSRKGEGDMHISFFDGLIKSFRTGAEIVLNRELFKTLIKKVFKKTDVILLFKFYILSLRMRRFDLAVNVFLSDRYLLPESNKATTIAEYFTLYSFIKDNQKFNRPSPGSETESPLWFYEKLYDPWRKSMCISVDLPFLFGEFKGLKGKEKDSYGTKDIFNNRFLVSLDLENIHIRKFWDIFGLFTKALTAIVTKGWSQVFNIWDSCKKRILGSIKDFEKSGKSSILPTVLVSVNRGLGQIERNFDDVHTVLSRMGYIVVAIPELNEETHIIIEKYLEFQDEDEWNESYGY